MAVRYALYGVLALTVAAAAAAARAQEQEPPKEEHFLTDAKWGAAPSGAELAALFPETARAAHVTGETITVCRITALGRLTDCIVAEETPPGYGFARASIQAVALVRVAPPDDGRPLEGERLRLRFRWGAETTIQVVAPAGRPGASPPTPPPPAEPRR